MQWGQILTPKWDRPGSILSLLLAADLPPSSDVGRPIVRRDRKHLHLKAGHVRPPHAAFRVCPMRCVALDAVLYVPRRAARCVSSLSRRLALRDRVSRMPMADEVVIGGSMGRRGHVVGGRSTPERW